MADCMFCEKHVGDLENDEGYMGKVIGKQTICESCLSELKEALEDV